MPEFHGLPCCDCQTVWLPAFEREATRRGLIASLDVFQLIGGNVRSGGTHLGGGAADFRYTDGLVALARQMGADATWHRPFNWDGEGGSEHIHSLLRGCPHLTDAAKAQIVAVDNGGDGLKGNNPDTGPRPLSGRTWREGIDWATQQEDEDMISPEAQDQVRTIVREELLAVVKSLGELAKVDHDGDPTTPKWSFERMLRALDN